MSIVLELALKQGLITREQFNHAKQTEANRLKGTLKAQITRRRKLFMKQLCDGLISKTQYLNEILRLNAEEAGL